MEIGKLGLVDADVCQCIRAGGKHNVRIRCRLEPGHGG